MRRRGSPLLRPTRLTWCGRNSENWFPRNATTSTTAGSPAAIGRPSMEASSTVRMGRPPRPRRAWRRTPRSRGGGRRRGWRAPSSAARPPRRRATARLRRAAPRRGLAARACPAAARTSSWVDCSREALRRSRGLRCAAPRSGRRPFRRWRSRGTCRRRWRAPAKRRHLAARGGNDVAGTSASRGLCRPLRTRRATTVRPVLDEVDPHGVVDDDPIAVVQVVHHPATRRGQRRSRHRPPRRPDGSRSSPNRQQGDRGGCQHEGRRGVEPLTAAEAGCVCRLGSRRLRGATPRRAVPRRRAARRLVAPSPRRWSRMVRRTPAVGRQTPRRHSRSGEGVAPPTARRSPLRGRRRRLCGPARSGRPPIARRTRRPRCPPPRTHPPTKRIRSSRPSDPPASGAPDVTRAVTASHVAPGRRRRPGASGADGDPETTATAANRPPEPPGLRGARSARPSPGRGRRRRP